jgi:HTH-type transcriptional regulator, bacterioopsin transcriptional activator and related proteins
MTRSLLKHLDQASPGRDLPVAPGAPNGPSTSDESEVSWTRELAQIGHAAAGDTTEQAFLDDVVHRVARTLRLPLCKILEGNQQGPWLLARAGVGWGAGVVGGARVTTSSTSHAGLALALGSPVVCIDLGRVVHFREAALLRRHGAVSGIATVIGNPDQPFGVLSAHATMRREFTAEETRFLQRTAALLETGIRRRREVLREQVDKTAP